MKSLKTILIICISLMLFTTLTHAKKDKYPSEKDEVVVDQLPTIKKEVLPEYPRLAKQAGLDGDVWVKVLVDKKGNVRKARIEKSSGTTSLDEAAIKSSYKIGFSPARNNGKKVAVWIIHKVEFIITRSEKWNEPGEAEGISKVSQYSLPAVNTVLKTDSLPVLIKEVLPKYPDSSLVNNISGIIRVKALIDKDGSVVMTKTKSSDKSKSELEAETIKASLLFKFQPALFKNKPVAVWVDYKIQFSILDADANKYKVRIIGLNSPSEIFLTDNIFQPNDGTGAEVYPEPDEFVPVEDYPKMIVQTRPVYPPEAKEAGITGDVYVKVLVDKKGKVINSMIAKSSGTVALDESAMEASYNNEFSPGIRKGKPVAVWVSYKVSFSLNDEEK